MDALLPIIPNSMGRYPTYLKGSPLWSLTTDRLGGWTLWRLMYTYLQSPLLFLNDLAESWTPISRATIWCNVRYTTRPNKTWVGTLISEASQVLIYLKIESFKSLPRIPVYLMSEILTGLRYCCINRLTLTWCFRRITQKEVCNPLNRFLNFL